ncbi:U32 family peptidase, partial [Pseudomonas sp. CM25]|nr:U32 family peptidase [Pseudomonas sp. CM25]
CNRQQQAIEVAPGDGHVVYLPIPEQVALEYALLMRDIGASEAAS